MERHLLGIFFYFPSLFVLMPHLFPRAPIPFISLTEMWSDGRTGGQTVGLARAGTGLPARLLGLDCDKPCEITTEIMLEELVPPAAAAGAGARREPRRALVSPSSGA